MKLLRKSMGAVIGILLIASDKATAQLKDVDYERPSPLTGKIYETASGTNKVLFTFKRTATRSNSTVFVTRDFFHTDGSLAAREQIMFGRGRLVSFSLDEKQTGSRGTATVAADTRNPSRDKLVFSWVTTDGGKTKTKTDNEAFEPETLVGDMIPYFVLEHWSELARGEALSFRFIVSSRLETVGFKLTKESETTWRGKPVLRLRMEPSSIVIRQLVDPLYFTVERDGAHRILEYIGRTTPKIREGSKWKDLDVRTIYDW